MSPTRHHSHSPCSAQASEDEAQTRQKRCLLHGLSTYCVQHLLLGRNQRKEGLWPCPSLRTDEDSQNSGAGNAGLQQTAPPGDTGEPSQALRTKARSIWSAFHTSFARSRSHFCKASPCSQSIWTFASVSADSISALDIQKVKLRLDSCPLPPQPVTTDSIFL